MPYYEPSEEMIDNLGQEQPPGSEFYEPAQAEYNFNTPDTFMKLFRDALLSAGYTRVRCHYDGGHDEGFSYFDCAVGETAASGDELEKILKAGLALDATALLYADSGLPARYREANRERIMAAPADKRIREGLEEFASVLANRLLGRGFGTGEYSLRGRFEIDLSTGRITDQPDEE